MVERDIEAKGKIDKDRVRQNEINKVQEERPVTTEDIKQKVSKSAEKKVSKLVKKLQNKKQIFYKLNHDQSKSFK